MKRKRLGEILSERGQISLPDLANALKEQQIKVLHLGELLLEKQLVPKDELLSALWEVSGIEYADCSKAHPPAELLKIIPAALARRCKAVPVRREGKVLIVVMAEPQNLQVLDELRFKTELVIEPRFGFQSEVLAAIERLYTGSDAKVDMPQVTTTLPAWSSSRLALRNATLKPSARCSRSSIRNRKPRRLCIWWRP